MTHYKPFTVLFLLILFPHQVTDVTLYLERIQEWPSTHPPTRKLHRNGIPDQGYLFMTPRCFACFSSSLDSRCRRCTKNDIKALEDLLPSVLLVAATLHVDIEKLHSLLISLLIFLFVSFLPHLPTRCNTPRDVCHFNGELWIHPLPRRGQ